jgi:SAM-dependent methyltransferase
MISLPMCRSLMPRRCHSRTASLTWCIRGVLHHTPNTEVALDEVYRFLKPGGRFVIMLYNRYSLVVFRLYFKYALRAGRPFRSLQDLLAQRENPGTKAYTRRELENMFRRFEDVALGPVHTPYDTHRLPRWSRRWLPPALGWFVVVTGRRPAP